MGNNNPVPLGNWPVPRDPQHHAELQKLGFVLFGHGQEDNKNCVTSDGFQLAKPNSNPNVETKEKLLSAFIDAKSLPTDWKRVDLEDSDSILVHIRYMDETGVPRVILRGKNTECESSARLELLTREQGQALVKEETAAKEAEEKKERAAREATAAKHAQDAKDGKPFDHTLFADIIGCHADVFADHGYQLKHLPTLFVIRVQLLRCDFRIR